MPTENAAKPEHPLGVALMDDDHAVLEALLAKGATLADKDLPAHLTAVQAETTAHFAREEDLMRQHGVPVLFCHIAQHQRILELLKAADGFVSKGDLARLRLFLTEMLPAEVEAHINSVDRMSARFIAGDMSAEATNDLRLPERDVMRV